MADSKKRGANSTEKQKQLMVEFVKQKPQMISGKQTYDYTYKDAKKDWETIGNILNSMPGAVKDWKGWRKAWHDIRSRTKTKEGKNKTAARVTGGGPCSLDNLTSVEEDVLKIIKEVSVGGHKAAAESIAKFNKARVPQTINGNLEEVEADRSDRLEEYDYIITSPSPVQVDNLESPETAGDNIRSSEPEAAGLSQGTGNSPRNFPTGVAPKDPIFTNTAAGQKTPLRKIPKKLDNLINSAVAATTFECNLKTKTDLKREYYERKVAHFEAIEAIKARKASALESIAMSLEILREKINCD